MAAVPAKWAITKPRNSETKHRNAWVFISLFFSLDQRNSKKITVFNIKELKRVFLLIVNLHFTRRVEKTDPRSADYPLTPAPRTSLWATPRTTLRTNPTDYPKKSTKFLLRCRKIQEPYLLFLHDHNCMKNSRLFLFGNFSTQSISFSSHSSPATGQNAVSTMDDR